MTHPTKAYTAHLQVTELGSRQFDMMIDTGASLNCIHYNAALKFTHLWETTNSAWLVHTANGLIEVRRYINVELKHKNTSIGYHRFWILEKGKTFSQKHDWLIGRPVINKMMKDPSKFIQYNSGKYIHTRSHGHEEAECFSDESDEHIGYEYDDNDFEQRINQELPPNIRTKIKNTMMFHSKVFSTEYFEIGIIPNTYLDIPLWHNEPISLRRYHMSPEKEQILDKYIDEMLEQGLITESDSPYSAPVILRPKKKPGEWRVLIDYRLLNAITINDEFPLPDINELLTSFHGCNYFSSLDVRHGYYNLLVHPRDRHKTAFITHRGLYEWNRAPQGLKRSPAAFQRAMNKMLRHLPYVRVYLDDILIASKNINEHIKHITTVLNVLDKHGLKIRPDKCVWAQHKLEFLGVVITGKGILPAEKAKQKALQFTRPKNVKEIQQFIGVITWLSRWIPNLAKLTYNINKLRQKNVVFEWSEQCEKDFQQIKNTIENTNLLSHPDPMKNFHVFVDASMTTIGGILCQYDDAGILRPIEFGSKTLDTVQQNWHVSEQELYACVYFIRKWRRHLMPKTFFVYTDHKNLEVLFNHVKQFQNKRLIRWAIELSEYSFVAQYIKGSENIIADYLSRYTDIKALNFMKMDTKTRRQTKQYFDTDTDKSLIHYTLNALTNKPTNAEPPIETDTDEEFVLYDLLKLLNDCNNEEVRSTLNEMNLEPKPMCICTSWFRKTRFKHELCRTCKKPIINTYGYKCQKKLHNMIHCKECYESGKAKGMILVDKNKPIHIPEHAYDLYPVELTEFPEPDSDTRSVISEPPDPNDLNVPTDIPKLEEVKPLPTIPELEAVKNEITDIPNLMDVDENIVGNINPQKKKLRSFLKRTVKQNKQFQNAQNDEPIYIDLYDINIADDDIKDEYTSEINIKERNNVLSAISVDKDLLIRKQRSDIISRTIIYNIQNPSSTLHESLPQWARNLFKNITVRSRQKFVLRNGLLCLHTPSDNINFTYYNEYRIYIPWQLRYSVIRKLHDTLIHPGNSYQLKELKKQFYWPNMDMDVKMFVQSCETCKQCKIQKNIKYVEYINYEATQMNEILHIDMVGPLPITEPGYKYLVTMVDRFSRYAMAIPVCDMEAMTVAKAMMRWISIFGPPKICISDQGPNFMSDIFQNLCKILNIDKKRTTPYHPQTNARVERFHRYLKTRIKILQTLHTRENYTQEFPWHDFVDIIIYVYNTTYSRSIDTTPASIAINNKVLSPSEWNFHKFKVITDENYDRYITHLKSIIINKAIKTQDIVSKQNNKLKNKQTIPYKLGDYVWFNIGHKLKTKAERISAKAINTGPWQIVSLFNKKKNVTLRCIHTNRFETTQTHNISPFTRKPKHLPTQKPYIYEGHKIWDESDDKNDDINILQTHQNHISTNKFHDLHLHSLKFLTQCSKNKPKQLNKSYLKNMKFKFVDQNNVETIPKKEHHYICSLIIKNCKQKIIKYFNNIDTNADKLIANVINEF